MLDRFLFCVVTGVISVSWYPPHLADDQGHDVDSVMPLLLDAADKQKLKVFLLSSFTFFCKSHITYYFYVRYVYFVINILSKYLF